MLRFGRDRVGFRALLGRHLGYVGTEFGDTFIMSVFQFEPVSS